MTDLRTDAYVEALSAMIRCETISDPGQKDRTKFRRFQSLLRTLFPQVFSISPQLCVVAFAFGDGFSNVFGPTNPALLISLGLVDVDYGKWFRWSWRFQTMNLILTSLLLLPGLAVGY